MTLPLNTDTGVRFKTSDHVEEEGEPRGGVAMGGWGRRVLPRRRLRRTGRTAAPAAPSASSPGPGSAGSTSPPRSAGPASLDQSQTCFAQTHRPALVSMQKSYRGVRRMDRKLNMNRGEHKLSKMDE